MDQKSQREQAKLKINPIGKKQQNILKLLLGMALQAENNAVKLVSDAVFSRVLLHIYIFQGRSYWESHLTRNMLQRRGKKRIYVVQHKRVSTQMGYRKGDSGAVVLPLEQFQISCSFFTRLKSK